MTRLGLKKPRRTCASGGDKPSALRDLLVRLGVEIDGKDKVKQVDKDLQGFLQTARLATRVFVSGGLINGIKGFISGLIEQADALKHNAERLGLTTDELQKYQYVAQTMQVPAQQVAVAFRFFNRAIGEAHMGTKSAVKVFSDLGVKITDAQGKVKPTADLLFEVADSMKVAGNSADRTALAMRLLGRGGSSLIPVLQNGNAALREMFQDVEELGGGFNETFIEQAHEIDRQQRRLAMGWRSVGVAIVSGLMPYIRAWSEHAIKNVKVMIDLVKHTTAVRTSIVALGVVLSAAATAFAIWKAGLLVTNPVLALMVAGAAALFAALGGIYLVLDDLYGFLNGKDSLIGELLGKMGGTEQVNKFFDDMTAAIDQIKVAFFGADASTKSWAQTLMQAFTDSLPTLINWVVTGMGAVIGSIDTAVTALKELWGIGKIVGSFLGGLGIKMFGGGDESFAGLDESLADLNKTGEEFAKRQAALSAAIDAARNLGKGGAPGAPTSAPWQPGDLQRGPEEAPVAPFRMDQNPLGQAPVINQHIEVHGAADPKKVGDAAANGASRALKDHAAQNRDAFDGVGAGMPIGGGA